MTLQDKINKHLQNEIAREVMVKRATKKAQDTFNKRQVDARRKIEDLQEQKLLESEFLSDYED